jgi:hypothetical protein
MKILIRSHSEREWKLVESAAYDLEDELQRLLAESPSLISIEDVRPNAGPLVVAVREFSLSVGYIDLLAFSAEGDIVLIECKLASNPEVKRKVIGQILEYGANLWEMTYEELDDIVRLRSEENLAELVKQAIQSQDWDEEKFRSNVKISLAKGNFILIIVVDEINEDLARIMNFVNACGSPSFDFAALEMRRFQSENAEMLVPRVVGPISVGKSGRSVEPVNQWDESSFFDELKQRHGDDAVRAASYILDWAQDKMQVWWGQGKQNGSFVPIFDHTGRKHQLFAVNTNGFVETYFTWYARKPPFDAEEKRIELLQRLNQIQGVNIPEDAINRRPSIKLTTLANDEVLEQFLSIYDWVVEEILKYTALSSG